jgi:LemA protein
MKWSLIILLALILVLIFLLAGIYNKLVAYSVRVDNSWAQIDVQLKKRFDLIPNLVETVKGYATHEKTTLEEVTKWRSAAMSAKTPEEAMENNQKLSKAIVNLFATAEQYPDLKADQSFLDLQAQLKDIESKIAISRQFYNDTVMKYNEYVIRFPSNIFASLFHFTQKKYYEIEETEKAVPQVKF